MTERSLAGQIAVVTGGAGGLGSASALRLARAGAAIVLVDRDQEAADAVAKQIQATVADEGLPASDGLAGQVLAVAADVSREEDVVGYMQLGTARFGKVDLHHLNAGIPGSSDPLVDLTVEDFDKVIGVNLRGPFLGLREAFRAYRRQGSMGSIVVTASIASLRGSSDLFAYHASKHGVVGLVRNAAIYGGPMGIRVNAVAPGIIPTPLFGSGAGPGRGGDMERRASTTPLRRSGSPEEVAGAVAFLMGPESTYITGEVLSVDGGATAVNTVRPSGGAGSWDTSALDARTAFRR